ncbi:MAG: hypothetical protein ACKV1O_25770 [Saprospiraceae bacterium]
MSRILRFLIKEIAKNIGIRILIEYAKRIWKWSCDNPSVIILGAAAIGLLLLTINLFFKNKQKK